MRLLVEDAVEQVIYEVLHSADMLTVDGVQNVLGLCVERSRIRDLHLLRHLDSSHRDAQRKDKMNNIRSRKRSTYDLLVAISKHHALGSDDVLCPFKSKSCVPSGAVVLVRLLFSRRQNTNFMSSLT